MKPCIAWIWRLTNTAEFNELFIVQPKNYLEEYVEQTRENNLSLYVVANPFEAIQYTYYTYEIRPELFKNLLFEDPSIVQQNSRRMQLEKYTDDMSSN